MTSNREALSAPEYLDHLINIFTKHNCNTSSLIDILNSYKTSIIYASPETYDMYGDRSKHAAFNYICTQNSSFNSELDTELEAFFNKYT